MTTKEHFSLESYFYDLEAVEDEADDPLDAVIFHWPKTLSPDNIVMTAGHLAATFQFCSNYLQSSDDSDAETNPDGLLRIAKKRPSKPFEKSWPGWKTGYLKVSTGKCKFGILNKRYILFILLTSKPPQTKGSASDLKTFAQSGLRLKLNSAEEISNYLEDTFDDILAASEFVHSGFSNIIETCENHSAKETISSFLEKYFSLEYEHRRIGCNQETSKLCKEYLGVCRETTSVLAGGLFVNGDRSDHLGRTIYFSHSHKGFEKLIRWFHLLNWSELSTSSGGRKTKQLEKNYRPSGVGLRPFQFQEEIWQLFSDILDQDQISICSRASSGRKSRKSSVESLAPVSTGRASAARASGKYSRKSQKSKLGSIRSNQSKRLFQESEFRLPDAIRKMVLYDRIQTTSLEETTLNDKEEENLEYSLFTQTLGNVRVILILSRSVVDIDEAILKHLWSIGVAKLPSIVRQVNMRKQS